MGILDGVGYALGAAADTGAAGMMDQFRAMVEQDRAQAMMTMMTMKSHLDLQHAQAMEDMKNAPLKRFSVTAQQMAQEDVPVTAAQFLPRPRTRATAA